MTPPYVFDVFFVFFDFRCLLNKLCCLFGCTNFKFHIFCMQSVPKLDFAISDWKMLPPPHIFATCMFHSIDNAAAGHA